jgi:16S rRNA (adenine1518-N6/adenine1519-N6)-dimethyltransferase
LAHPQIAERIALTAGVQRGDTVLEVGPGTGILTAALLEAGAHVVAVEADETLLAPLRERFAGELAQERLVIVHADIRTYLAGPMRELPGLYAVVANIPYYITGEILRLLLENARQPLSVTLLVQKEVAERIARSKKESLLSLSVKAYGSPRYAFTVPKGAFRPAPSVDSAVLAVRDISRSHFSGAREEKRFFALIHAGFAHKRKRLAKNLEEAGFTEAATRVGDVRAEDVSLAEWLALAK